MGIGTPAQAAEVCGFADGVVVGSALMSRVVGGDLEGAARASPPTFREAIPSEPRLRHLRRPAGTYDQSGYGPADWPTGAGM